MLSSVFTLLTPLPLKIAVDSVIGSKPLPGPLDALPRAVSGSHTGILIFAAALFVLITLLKQVLQVPRGVLVLVGVPGTSVLVGVLVGVGLLVEVLVGVLIGVLVGVLVAVLVGVGVAVTMSTS